MPVWDHIGELSERLKVILIAVGIASLIVGTLPANPFSLSSYRECKKSLPRNTYSYSCADARSIPTEHAPPLNPIHRTIHVNNFHR